jgi:phage-related protein
MKVPNGGKLEVTEIHWEGDAKEVLSSFPQDIKDTFGFALREMQNGEEPPCSHRSMSTIGQGVWELREQDARTWYRLMYLTRIGNVIHVLHCFEKNSRRTSPRDIAIAIERLQTVRQRLMLEKKEKRKS